MSSAAGPSLSRNRWTWMSTVRVCTSPLVAPHLLEQAGARHDLVAVLDEVHEQAHLHRGDTHAIAIDRDSMGDEIDRERPHGKNPPRGGGGRRLLDARPCGGAG